MKNITKLIILLFFFPFLIQSAYPEEEKPFKPRFSIKITGGSAYMSLGDINEYLDSKLKFSTEDAERHWPVYYSYTDGIENIHYGLNFEGDLRINIVLNFSIGISTGLIDARKESYSIFRGESYTTTTTIRESYEQKILITPFRLGIYYQLSLFKRTALLFNVGAGYYFARSTLYDYQHGATHWFIGDLYERYWTEHTYKVNGKNFGIHGGIGFEYTLGRNLSLVIEGQGRYAKIKELKGKDIMVTSGASWENGKTYWTEDKEIIYGTLWYYRWQSEEGIWRTYLPFSDIKPELPPNAPPHIVRKAMLDLSGFSVKIGIRIGLL